MEKLFVTKLEIKKVRHLKDITINLSDTTSRHLIFTGKNGSGKTSVLDAIAAYLKMKFQVSDLDLEKTKEMDLVAEALKVVQNEKIGTVIGTLVKINKEKSLKIKGFQEEIEKMKLGIVVRRGFLQKIL